MLLPDDLNQRLDLLLRNRISGLRWDYFELDLNVAAADPRARASEEEVRLFFSRLPCVEGEDVSASAASVDLNVGEPSHARVVSSRSANEALAYFFALRRLEPAALAAFIQSQLDSNELLNRSDAYIGTLGNLNRRERKRRNAAFRRKIAAGHRAREGALVILVEGDSWFQFPKLYVYRPVVDLVHYLLKDTKYAVKTLAAGGDWLAEIARSAEYFEVLAEVRPNVLLLSGGGNDLVGNKRLSMMVRNGTDTPLSPRLQRLLEVRARNAEVDLGRYRNGLRFVSDTFLDFLNQYFLIYFSLVDSLHQDESLGDVLIVTQGYDYVIPSGKRRGGPLKRLVNRVTGSGKWLYGPLTEAGITGTQDQRDVMYVLIYEFNEMLIKLPRYDGFPQVRHLDVRGFARGEQDWYDELHLTSAKNKRLAENYQALITAWFDPYVREPIPRVWRVR